MLGANVGENRVENTKGRDQVTPYKVQVEDWQNYTNPPPTTLKTAEVGRWVECGRYGGAGVREKRDFYELSIVYIFIEMSKYLYLAYL